MLFDVAAEVTANTRLSPDYNVISLRAPEIAHVAGPGQFVMVKPQAGIDPLLRRPFSIFERILDASGAPVGITLLNKRVGAGTTLLFAAEPGDRVGVLGPLGQPFVPVDPPAQAWMVAGGVGLAPFSTLDAALKARGTPRHLFYGARSKADLHYADHFERDGRAPSPVDGRRFAGRSRPNQRTVEAGARRRARRFAHYDLCMRPDPDDARGRRVGRSRRPSGVCLTRTDDGLRHGRLLFVRRARAAGNTASVRPRVYRRTRV
jgi:ferredoxin-NADP reductase